MSERARKKGPPSNIYRRLLRGEVTSERYVAVVKRAVDMSFSLRKSAGGGR